MHLHIKLQPPVRRKPGLTCTLYETLIHEFVFLYAKQVTNNRRYLHSFAFNLLHGMLRNFSVYLYNRAQIKNNHIKFLFVLLTMLFIDINMPDYELKNNLHMKSNLMQCSFKSLKHFLKIGCMEAIYESRRIGKHIQRSVHTHLKP